MEKLAYIAHKIDALSAWSGKVMSFLIYATIGVMMFEVVARYVFNSPTIWAVETSTMVFGVYVLGAGVYTHLYRQHVKMDVFYSHWSQRTKAIVDACTFLLFLTTCVVLLWKSGVYAGQSLSIWEHSSTAWGPPLYPLKVMIPVIVLLMVLQGISHFIHDLTFAVTKKELP